MFGFAASQRPVAIALLFAVLLAGCAADPLASERKRILQGWGARDDAPLLITRAAEAPPAPELIEEESTWLETAVLAGAAGALAPWLGMAAGGSVDVEVAAFLTPIFAVGAAAYGAVAAKPRERVLAPDQAPGALPLLLRAVQDRRFEDDLVARIAAVGDREAVEPWRIAAAAPASGETDDGLVVTIALERFAFLRDRGDEEFALALAGGTYIADATTSRRVSLRPWRHESNAHSLAEWLAQDGILFDRILDEAEEEIAQEIAQEIVEDLTEGLQEGASP
jgi:hypothetical protein